ncbi:MAG: FgL, flagellar protein [Candidatus Ruminococcus intestinipullorum]|nr:FgL, flagellar protein [Candidatus Ruminococcus intestinipullorum]
MRITENSLNRTYIKNLQRNLSDLSSSNLKLASGRKYNHVSEDTGNAARAFVVRDQISKNEEYINTVESAIGELNTADDNIMTVSSVLKTVYERVVSAGSGTKSQEDLNVIAEELKGLKNEIIQTMNARYGDKFLFAGSNNDEPPFTVDDTGKIFFNGVAVDDAKSTTDFNENKVVYLDIGFGMSSRPGGINAQTGLKISTSGVDALGYGVDANGEPNNICSLISKIEEQLRSGDVQGAGDTMKHLKKSEENLSACIAEMGTRQSILDRAKDRLEAENINLKSRQVDLEAVSLEEESINNKSYEMAWMVTLQLGSSIIPPSIFDFMR